MSKVLGNVVVALLVVTVAILAVAVNHWNAATTPPDHFRGVHVSTSKTSSPAADAVPATAVFIGDFTAGSDQGGEGDRNWTAQVAALVGPDHPIRVVADNSGGSGYVIRGALTTFPDRVQSIVTSDANVVVIAGSRDDMVAEPRDVLAAAAQTYATVHQTAPGAVLLVVGPSWIDDNPPPRLLQTRDAVKAAAQAAGAIFIDPLGDHWFSEPGLVAPDGIHPTDEGHHKMAVLMAPLVSDALDRSASGTQSPARGDVSVPSETVTPNAFHAG